VNAIAVNVHRYAIHYEARHQALPGLHSPTGIELARIDAAKILTLPSAGSESFRAANARLNDG
jgi:hypothetical protein